ERLRRRLVAGPDDGRQVRLDAHVVDDGLDDAVRDVPVADPALGVLAAEQQGGIADADLLRDREGRPRGQDERTNYEAESLGPVHRRSSVGERARSGPTRAGTPPGRAPVSPCNTCDTRAPRIARKICGVGRVGCATAHGSPDTNVGSRLLTKPLTAP